MAVARSAGVNSLRAWVRLCRRPAPCDDTQVTDVGPDGALAGDPQLPALVDLGLGEVVVAVDAPRLLARADEPQHLGQGPVHHLDPVGLGVVLGPEHVGHVLLELRRALHEPGQVGVLEAEHGLLGQSAGLGDVALG